MKTSVYSLALATALAGMGTMASAETWRVAHDRDMVVAQQKALNKAAELAIHRGTCVSHYPSSARCKKIPDGRWECGAAASKYVSSCTWHDRREADIVFRETMRWLTLAGRVGGGVLLGN